MSRLLWALRRPALLSLAVAVLLVLVALVHLLAGHAVLSSVLGLALAAAGAAVLVAARHTGRPVRRGSTLVLDLPRLPPDRAVRGMSLRDVVETLDHAATDERIARLVVLPCFGRAGLAGVQELRDAIARVAASGTPTIAYAADYSTNGEYYLATACAEVVLQPLGGVGLTGLAAEPVFARRALDAAGIRWVGDRRREYKSAADRFVETGLTEANREQLTRVLTSQFDQIVAGVAAGRGLDPTTVRSLADRAPLMDDEAVAERLVDRLGHRDDVVPERPLTVERYRRAVRRPGRRATTVALLTAGGAIVDRAPGLPAPGRRVVGDEFAAEVRRAVRPRRVRALVVRVDSPGGAVSASETIRRALEVAGKPVVVSMGNVAASGGYWIATAARRVVAQPGTVTGSIGVLNGKPVVAGLAARAGLDVDPVAVGANALMYSPHRDYGERGWERVQTGLDRIYDGFVERVAAARKLPVERVGELARGRVWTGADAYEHGLVDDLGGLDVAIRAAAELAGAAPGAPVRVVDPSPRGLRAALHRRTGRPDLAAVLAPALQTQNRWTV